MRTHSDYRIGWICALPIELAAAEAMLDQVHDSLPNRLEDENTYILGSIAKHSIVVACLPAGVYGTTSATSVATHMKISFPALRFCLLVGIAGGAPGPQADIRLGDIVVSKPTAGYGGVIQYDYGKALAGEFRPTGFLNKPPAVLLTAVARLQARHHLHGTNIHRVTTRIFKTHDRLSGTFSSPAQDKDLLFLSSYEHVGNEEDCLACDKSKVQPRPTRRSIEPQVFYGLVASANQVLRDAARRTTLSRQHGILCFEMEAAGIMDVLPCLVIRGVCDYCDSHKNKRWQAYAATTAAAYTKELLSVIPFQAVTRTPVVNLSASYMQSLDHVDHSDQRQPSPVPSVRDSPAGSSAQSQWAQSLESSPSPSPITELPTSPGSKPNDQPLESIGASQTDCVVDFTTQPSEAASPQPAVSIKSEPDKIIVAMDIGSRYTRVAYATAQDTRLGKTTPITRWPNHDDPVDKVPTLVSYQNWLYSWGYDIPETDIPFPWLWAVLLSDTDFSEYAVLNTDRIPVINRARGPLPSVHDLPAGHAISHYLRALWMHTVQTMRGNLGPDTVDRTRFHIVLTLPTVWDRGGQRALRKAAKIAGLLQRRQAGATKLNIVRKSTAAAQAAMYESIRDARLGDSYVICYAGGRSMDVGTYRVSTLLDMSRSVGRKWVRCGGDSVDGAFEALLQRSANAMGVNLSKTIVQYIMTNEWEPRIKRTFCLAGESTVFPLKLQSYREKSARIHDILQTRLKLEYSSLRPILESISPADVAQVFANTISTMRDLIDDQIHKVNGQGRVVKGIILAGGLGSSPQVYDCLKAAYGPEIRVAEAENTSIPTCDSSGRSIHRMPSSACRGAIYQAHLSADDVENELAAVESEEDEQTSSGADEDSSPAADGEGGKDNPPASSQSEEDDDLLTSSDSDGTDEDIRPLDPLAEIIYLNLNQ